MPRTTDSLGRQLPDHAITTDTGWYCGYSYPHFDPNPIARPAVRACGERTPDDLNDAATQHYGIGSCHLERGHGGHHVFDGNSRGGIAAEWGLPSETLVVAPTDTRTTDSLGRPLPAGARTTATSWQESGGVVFDNYRAERIERNDSGQQPCRNEGRDHGVNLICTRILGHEGHHMGGVGAATVLGEWGLEPEVAPSAAPAATLVNRTTDSLGRPLPDGAERGVNFWYLPPDLRDHATRNHGPFPAGHLANGGARCRDQFAPRDSGTLYCTRPSEHEGAHSGGISRTHTWGEWGIPADAPTAPVEREWAGAPAHIARFEFRETPGGRVMRRRALLTNPGRYAYANVGIDGTPGRWRITERTTHTRRGLRNDYPWVEVDMPAATVGAPTQRMETLRWTEYRERGESIRTLVEVQVPVGTYTRRDSHVAREALRAVLGFDAGASLEWSWGNVEVVATSPAPAAATTTAVATIPVDALSGYVSKGDVQAVVRDMAIKHGWCSTHHNPLRELGIDPIGIHGETEVTIKFSVTHNHRKSELFNPDVGGDHFDSPRLPTQEIQEAIRNALEAKLRAGWDIKSPAIEGIVVDIGTPVAKRDAPTAPVLSLR